MSFLIQSRQGVRIHWKGQWYLCLSMRHTRIPYESSSAVVQRLVVASLWTAVYRLRLKRLTQRGPSNAWQVIALHLTDYLFTQ